MAVLLRHADTGVADYVLNLYFRSNDGVYVNMFAPSEVTWQRGTSEVKLIQETDYPAGDETKLWVRTARPLEFAIYLRIPGWLRSSAKIYVNGRPSGIAVQSGSFAVLRKEWMDNDCVEVKFAQEYRVESIDDLHPNTVALMRGPVMYVALSPAMSLFTSPLDMPGELQPIAESRQAWLRRAHGQEIVFVPFYAIRNQSYNTYFLKG